MLKTRSVRFIGSEPSSHTKPPCSTLGAPATLSRRTLTTVPHPGTRTFPPKLLYFHQSSFTRPTRRTLTPCAAPLQPYHTRFTRSEPSSHTKSPCSTLEAPATWSRHTLTTVPHPCTRTFPPKLLFFHQKLFTRPTRRTLTPMRRTRTPIQHSVI